jgi:hypothetical protein
MKALNCWGTVRQNQKVMPSDFRMKLRMKWVYTKARVMGDLAAVAWKDRQNINKWQICTVLKQKVMSVISMEMLGNQPLYSECLHCYCGETQLTFHISLYFSEVYHRPDHSVCIT